ncbi:hypothetical protein P4T20_05525 [Aneurinibacillus thermoaerophilus]|nr:hypothetical protein [Aneurinibacillus thermoaerophilus]
MNARIAYWWYAAHVGTCGVVWDGMTPHPELVRCPKRTAGANAPRIPRL